MLRVLVIDDEAPARRYLRRLLEASPDVHVAGEADCLELARTLIREHRPDALFLDIELTAATGFDLLDQLEVPPAVVFVTAHSDYAARAFDVQAVDYLLKPVRPGRSTTCSSPCVRAGLNRRWRGCVRALAAA